MKYIDLFAGIGGFHLAFKQDECVFSSEWNKACQEVYYNNFGIYPKGDITKIGEKDIPDFDILCAGFPCQPFSSCGLRKGFEDTRGTLFFDICRIIKEKKPKAILLENVKGLLTHDNGKTFNIIKTSLEELGYKVSYKVLNAKDFKVAQNRERIIIIGMKDYFDFKFSKFSEIKIEDILEDDNNYINDGYTLIENPVEQESGLIFAGYRNKNTRKGTDKNLSLSRAHKQPNRIYSSKGIHPTIPSQEISGRFFILVNNKVRRLTLNEVYRLFGFPDNFKKSKNKSEAYRQIGNSVCVPMIEEIAKKIKLYLDKTYN